MSCVIQVDRREGIHDYIRDSCRDVDKLCYHPSMVLVMSECR
jgi:hypothetical protein